jgi:hypothetical protein
MSSIVPPLDSLPNIPGKSVLQVKQKLDQAIDVLISDCNRFIKSVTKLPKDCNCEDPRIQRAKLQLEKLQKQFNAIQSGLNTLQQTVDSIKNVVGIANTARNLISALQLINPTTSGVFIAQQAMMIQEAIIVNSLQSLTLFSQVPTSTIAKLSMMIPPILQSIETIGQVCNGDVEQLKVDKQILDSANKNPESSLNNIGSTGTGADSNDTIINDSLNVWNSELPTEFYNDTNVSDSDLIDRASVIKDYIDQLNDINEQINIASLLSKSITESPSEVYKGNGVPSISLGKVGDYYVDLDTMTAYGPKIKSNEWPLT